jgi:magnesium chelatase family protein
VTNLIKTGALAGIDGFAVSVETDISRGLPGFHLVGLPNTEVRESRERVLSALRNSGIKIPLGKITVNLAPAGIRKEGASYDLAIAMGVITSATRQTEVDSGRERSQALYLGELSLFGDLRPVRGLLSIVLDGVRRGEKLVVVPACQAWEARLVPGVEVVPATHLKQVVSWWQSGLRTESDPAVGVVAGRAGSTVGAAGKPSVTTEPADRSIQLLAALRGQALVRKAATIAVTGAHNFLLVGPPGTGKSRLARIVGDLQPDLSGEDALEVTRIHSAAGLLGQSALMSRRPFRAPHHTITRAGLIGGGSNLRPGEVTLAHRGILFLDEMTEFSSSVLDVLREPLQEGWISVSRGPGIRTYPADFQLVGAMNPCRCGYRGSPVRDCRCTPSEQTRYLSRLSGPLLDRFDLFVEMGCWEGKVLSADPKHNGRTAHRRGDQSSMGDEDWRVCPTRDVIDSARNRLAAARAHIGREAGETKTDDLLPETMDFLEASRIPLGLSLRGMNRCLNVARTIAALDSNPTITPGQIREALELRQGNLNLETN